MTLQRLLNTIGIIGVRDKMVNFTGCGGSVYELNDLTIKNYPILYVSPTGTHRVEENYTTYQLTIFYIDRLLEDNSNAVDIHSAAVEILKNIIRAIENTDGVIGVSDEYSINLFTETEKFKDRCNGAYATVEISVVNDTVCEVGYSWNGEPGTKKFIRIVTPANNNVNIPNTQNWFLFSWQTSEPSTHYSVLKCVEGGDCSVLMEGDTERTYLALEPIVNDGTSKIVYNLSVYNEGGDDWREVYHLPNYFLNFTNRDNVRISAEAYDYLVSWNTNLETVEWKLYRNDKLYSSGQTTNTSIMAQFPVNTSNETVAYRFVAGSPGGGFERTLNWRQRQAVVYYLNAQEYRWINPDESGVTIPFDTNCEGDIKFEWHYWNGETNIDLNETTWVYGTPMQVEVVVPSDRGNNYESLVWANAIYDGKEVGSIQAWCHNYFFKLQTSDNERIDSTATSYTINYETNYTGVDYTFGIERGTTSGGTLTLTFPENTGTSAVQMEILFQDLSGNVLGTLHWTQNQADTYFNILTASGQTVSAASTAFTINYETNIQPPIHYVYTSPFGVYEGDSWNQSSLTITFNPNDSQSLRERTVEIGGETVNWYQEVPYLNFTSYPSEITKDQQLVCFGWESNCDGKVKYEFSSGATSEGSFNFVRSGRTDSMSGDCITFSANTGDDRYYKMDIYASFAGNDTNYVASDSATFKQVGETGSGSTHHYGYDPLRQITGSPQSNQIFYRSTTGEAVPYGLMQGWATDMDGNDMWATSNVYQNGYGIVTFPRPILSANAVVDTEQVVEIVWPEGMELMGLDIYSSRRNIESVTLPSTLRKIPAQFFYQSTIRYINIPSFSRAGLMKCMNANAFNGNVDNLEIYYDGTVAQWNALNKGTDWLYHKRSGQKVICSDGLADA